MVKSNPIQPGKSSWGTFSVVRQQQAEILKSLIEEIAKDHNLVAGSERQILRNFYLAAMDSAAIEKQGAKLLQPLFEKIDSIRTRDQLAAVMGISAINSSIALSMLSYNLMTHVYIKTLREKGKSLSRKNISKFSMGSRFVPNLNLNLSCVFFHEELFLF